ncbi:MAG: QueT transporter family protein, partial [FCB group bacterium]|nr:QueT transporter family protein [FCB group bacterium]
LDIVFGPLITLLAAIATRYVYHLSKSNKYLFLTLLPLVLMWVGSVYLLSSFHFEGKVILGVILSVIAFVVMAFIGNKRISKAENKSISLILKITSLVLGIVASYLMKVTDNIYLVIVGTVLLLSALLTFMMFVHIRNAKGNYNVLIAPLPPVIFNAFGVSLYLAPLLGFNYWFSVQMVGVGELVACYLIGLPLLLLLEKRKIFV